MSRTEAMSICPYCKEDIRPDAVICKHCGSGLQQRSPSHEGVCPFCKEDIRPDAIICKHCRSSLAQPRAREGGCCRDEEIAAAMQDGFTPTDRNECFVECLKRGHSWRLCKANCYGDMNPVIGLVVFPD